MTSTELEKKTEELYNQRIENLRVEFTGKLDNVITKLDNFAKGQDSLEKQMTRMELSLKDSSDGEIVNRERIKQLFWFAGIINTSIVALISTVIGWLFNK